jgi:Tol biopolymer transport system component
MAIWTLSPVGGTLRKVRDDAGGAVPSPDGSRIAFISHGKIWLMGTKGEDANELFAPGKGYSFERVQWSPDGQRLAYMKSHLGYDEVLIGSRALTAGQDIVTMSDPHLRNFCWTPDGRILYARLENLKEASANIWEVGIDPSTWRTSGDPRRLTNWAGFTLLDLSVTADGKRISFVRKTDQSDVYLGLLEGKGSRLSSHRRLTLDDRMDWPGRWMREGNAVLFFSDRGGNFDIFKQGVNDRGAEEVVSGPSEEKRAPQLSPDGNWILYLAWPNTQSEQPPPSGRLMRAPVKGGAPETVLEVRGYPGSARVPRDRWLPTANGYPDFHCPSLAVPARPCVLSEIKDDQLVFFAFDPLQGRIGELARIDVDPSDAFWDLSPDGTRIAFGKCEPHGGHIRILDLGNGERTQLTVEGWACFTSAGWSSDGKSLFVTNWASRGGSILRVALNGKTKLLYKALGMSLERPVPSPDGRFLAYGEVTTISNAWMIESPSRPAPGS